MIMTFVSRIWKIVKSFLKNWTLPVAICIGAVAYLLYSRCTMFDFSRPYAAKTVAVVQPVLIFSMLFLSFCKIDVRSLRLRISHLWLLLIQCGSFVAMCLLIHFQPNISGKVVIESAMLCMICPTATSASVVTQKLQGNGADIIMYTLLINLAVAILFPLCVPLIYPQDGQIFIASFMLIIAKVFPMLICPLILAQFVRFVCPTLLRFLLSFHDLAFYLWAVSLSLAIAVTTRSIVHTNHSVKELISIAIISLICCILQFFFGRLIGKHYSLKVSTSQALGQKNTVLAIWMGYTFLNPISSIAGGFYSVWHNLYNTYQLRKKYSKE